MYYGRYRTYEKNEFKYTYKIFKQKYKLNVKLINASQLFIKKLKGISDPEKKKKLLVDYLLKIFEKESKKFNNIKYLSTRHSLS